jgi:DNA-binding XRE family transcriptional regulator
MQKTYQVIRQNGKPAFVLVPHSEWETIREMLEDAEDLRLAEEASRAYDAGGQRGYPGKILEKLFKPGAKRLRIIREWRGLTQTELAEKVGSDRVYISNIERGVRPAGRKLKKALAVALDVEEDVLFPEG